MRGSAIHLLKICWCFDLYNIVPCQWQIWELGFDAGAEISLRATTALLWSQAVVAGGCQGQW